jgi:hypothetical protein
MAQRRTLSMAHDIIWAIVFMAAFMERMGMERETL